MRRGVCLLTRSADCSICLGMYLRTTRRKNADGSTVEYHQLAENSWDAKKGCAVAKVIYNFGRAEQIDRVALRRLARSILRVFFTAGGSKILVTGVA